MELPETIRKGLESITEEARAVFGTRLCSVVLYGSAAEGKLRKTSDVNLVIVTQSYTTEDGEALSPILTFSAAAFDLQVMFLLRSEIETASELFAVKFSDISRRRRILFGNDPFVSLNITRRALLARLRQVLLNHLIRLRSAISLSNDSAELLSHLVADSVSPLRAAASSILELRGVPFDNPKQALQNVAMEMRPDGYAKTLETISNAREGKPVMLDQSISALADILDLTQQLKELVKSLE